MTEDPKEEADAPAEPAEEAPAEEAQEAQPEVAEEAPMGHSGGFRMTRDSQTDEFPAYDEARKPEYKPAHRAQKVNLTVDEAVDEVREDLTDARDEVTGAWKKTQDAVESTVEEVQDAVQDVTDTKTEESPLPDRRRRRNRRA